MKLMKGCWRIGKTEEGTDETPLMRNGALLLQESVAWFNGRRNPIRNFSVEEINKATNNLDPSLICRGSNSHVYKGTFQGFPICIKQFSEDVKLNEFDEAVGLKEAITDIVVSSQMSSHKNAVKLIGCCIDTPIPTRVFEFAEKGSLANILHGLNRQPLSWKCRLRIAADAANAVVYLHTAFARPIVHRNITTSKILLNRCNVAKLSDFSLSVSIPEGETHAVCSNLAGTYGFAAPEYMISCCANEKTDVFAFGVCLIELLTGQKECMPGRSRFNEFPLMSAVVKDYHRNGRSNEVVDPEILWEEGWPGKDGQLRDFTTLALSCVLPNEEDRPMMMDVARQLRFLEQSTPSDLT